MADLFDKRTALLLSGLYALYMRNNHFYFPMVKNVVKKPVYPLQDIQVLMGKALRNEGLSIFDVLNCVSVNDKSNNGIKRYLVVLMIGTF